MRRFAPHFGQSLLEIHFIKNGLAIFGKYCQQSVEVIFRQHYTTAQDGIGVRIFLTLSQCYPRALSSFTQVLKGKPPSPVARKVCSPGFFFSFSEDLSKGVLKGIPVYEVTQGCCQALAPGITIPVYHTAMIP